MGRGNVDKVIEDAPKIARRLRETDVTLTALIKEYHCGYPIMTEAIGYYISKREWKKIRHERMCRGNVKSRFQKGMIPWNKGRHYNAGGRSVETRFKKGHLRGQAARIWKPIGTINIRHDKPPKRLRGRKRKEGMPPWQGKPRRWIKVKDEGRPQDKWIPYARYLYEQKYGRLPDGFFVVHIDGDQMNDCIDNLTAVDRPGHLALQMKRDPGHELRMRKAAGKAALQRHEKNRQMKRLHGPLRIIFECVKCGADYKHKPGQCVKCGGGSFEKIQRREKKAG